MTEYTEADCILEWSEEATVLLSEDQAFNAFQSDSYVVRATFPDGLPLEPGDRSKGVREDPEYVRHLRIALTHQANAMVGKDSP